MSSPQLLDRLPTLFEVLNRISEKPVDLWSFYKFLREHYAGVDYLEFWLDTANHYALARAFSDEQQHHIVGDLSSSARMDPPASGLRLAQAMSQEKLMEDADGADVGYSNGGASAAEMAGAGPTSFAGQPSHSSSGGKQQGEAASLTDSQVFDLLNTVGPDSGSEYDWRRSHNSQLASGARFHDQSGSSQGTGHHTIYDMDASGNSIPRVSQVGRVGYSSGGTNAVPDLHGNLQRGNENGSQLMEPFGRDITPTGAAPRSDSEDPEKEHYQLVNRLIEEEYGREAMPVGSPRPQSNARHTALPQSAEEAAVPHPISNAAAHAAAQAEHYRRTTGYQQLGQYDQHRLETASVGGGTQAHSLAGTVTREQLEANADRIISQYLMAGAPREIILPRDMAARVRSAAMMGNGAGRRVPSLFNEPREYVFDVLEREAFPAFLQLRALSNVDGFSVPIRLIAGLIALFGAFWLSFVFIFLKWDPMAARCWVILPFSVGWYLVMSSLYSLDPLLGVVGLTKCGWFRVERISEPYVRFLIRRRSIFAGLVTLLITACFCVLFIFVPGHRL